MSEYVVVALIHQENAGFDISFPDFPVVVATGESVDQAVEHGRVMLSLYIKGMDEVGLRVPRPRTIEELRGDPAFYDRLSLAILAYVAIDYVAQ